MEHVGFYITAACCDKNWWAKDAIAYEMSEVIYDHRVVIKIV